MWGQFTAGNIAVYRVGDGSGALSGNATAAFIDVYTTSGATVQTITVPTTSVTNSGTATSEGFLMRSIDGRYLTWGGYYASVGTTVTSVNASVVNRVAARIDASGTIDASTKLTDAYNASNIRSVLSTDGTAFYTSGNGGSGQGASAGIRYISPLGATTSTALQSTNTNTRVVGIFNNQLYYSTSSAPYLGIVALGTGVPTSGTNTPVLLNGFPTASGPSSYGFAMSADGNTIYVADDRAKTAGGGLQKWTLSGGTWSLAYTDTIGLAAGLRSLTVDWTGTNPVIYAIDASSLSNLVKVTDTGVSSVFSTLATAATNTAWRGVSFTPNATISFTDGSSYAPSDGSQGTNDNPIGRFQLKGNINGSKISQVVVALSGTYSGVTNLKLYYCNSATFSTSNLLATVASPTSPVTFTVSSPQAITTSDGYFFIAADLGGSSIGSIMVSLADQSKLTFSNAYIANFSNANLSSSNVSLRKLVPVVTATASSGGTISPQGPVQVPTGTDTTFTITKNVGYHIDSVLVDGANVGVVTSYKFTNVTSNHTIAAYFSINKYTLSVITVGTGTVTINPVQTTYDSLTVVTLTANSGTNYSFKGWTGSVTSMTNPFIDTIKGNQTINAYFGATITSNGTGGGSWNSTSTWAGGVLPASTDSVIIAGTDLVSILRVVPDTCGSLVVQSGGTLRVDTNFVVKIGTLTVNGTLLDTLSGTVSVAGTISFGNGSLYRHARTGGSIPLATWGTGSTCALTGVTTASPGNGNQNFYNFIWNNPGQTTGLNLAWDNIVIGGDVTCTASGASAAQQFRMTASATTRNITIKGNIIVNGGYLTASGSSGAALYYVNVMGDIVVQSGKINLCKGSGGYANWTLCGNLSIASGAQFEVPQNTTSNNRLIFAKKNGIQTYTNAGTNANLSYGVDSNATVQLNSPLTVGNATVGALIMTSGKFVTSSTNLLTLASGVKVWKNYTATPSGATYIIQSTGINPVDSATVAYVDGPMAFTIASSTTVIDSLPLGKGSIYRPVILSITQDSSTSTIYTAELINGVPPARTLPASLDSISAARYVHIVKGVGANVSNATIQLSYTSNDAINVSDKDKIRIAKDDGAGNWINLGGSGTANNIGVIVSNAFGASTSLGQLTTNDFVIAHVNPASIPVIATLTTKPITDISTTFATSGGIISKDGNSAISAKGVCWNTAGSPTTADSTSKDGSTSTPFTSSLTGLLAGTKYYVRAYAVNSAGTAYGNELNFTTLTTLVAPTVTTDSVNNIVNTNATGYGSVTAWGGSPITDRGICWSTSHNPTITNDYNSSGTGSGSFITPIGGLVLGKTYYARAYATNSTGTSYGSELTFTTPAAQPNVYKIVDKNGTVGVNCDYKTVQAAFNAVPSNYTGHWFIYVKKGTYYEKDTLAAGKINVVLVGQQRDSTILTYDDYSGKNSGSSGTNTSYSVAIDAADFQAQNITFQNTANAYAPGSTASQAVALRTNGDRQSYYNCRMLGYQDTYYTQGGLTGPDRIYNKNCYIEGSVDFIFGRDVALFDSCTIFCNRNGGVLTAAATEVGFQFGYVFLNCTISSTPAGQNGVDGNPMVSFYLGRPWQAAPKTVYINCSEPATVNAAGWTVMGPSPALYSEYNCTGPGALASRPVLPVWTTNQPSTISSTQAAAYTVANILSKATAAAPYSYSANWVPSLIPMVITSVQNSSANQIPTSYALYQNYPNPFNPSTTISYDLPKSGMVSLKVYDVYGREITTLVDGVIPAGNHRETFNASRLASGVYFVHLQTEAMSQTIKILMLK
jgi:pectin methylesterase-like acyl-CoA thioesterase